MSVIIGRTWRFGDNINTDLMMPYAAYEKPQSERPKYVSSALRPGWSAQVQKGDIIIGGKTMRMWIFPMR